MNYKRTIAEIDLDALDYNIKGIKSIISEKTKILGTIKADGYGHGAVEVCKVLRENGVEIFSAANLDEAMYLRKNGIYEDILILGFTPKFCFKEVVENDIIQTVSSLEEAESLNSHAKEIGKTARIHIKIDTGMGRIGFFPDETALKEIEDIYNMENIKILGIYTHFAVSDIEDKTFTKLQRDRFLEFVHKLEKSGVNIPFKHCSNSGAVIDCEDMGMDLIRPGIIMYGLYPSEEVNKSRLSLKPVMTLKSQIAFVKEVEDNSSISYGRTYFTKGKRKIATIPIGYADGYSRSLSNKGNMLVGGKKVPIVGKVCMDYCMVDITDVPNVKVEDEVVVMGKMGDEWVTTEEIAEKMGTINYEVICLIDKRVPRVYIKGGKIVKVLNHLL